MQEYVNDSSASWRSTASSRRERGIFQSGSCGCKNLNGGQELAAVKKLRNDDEADLCTYHRTHRDGSERDIVPVRSMWVNNRRTCGFFRDSSMTAEHCHDVFNQKDKTLSTSLTLKCFRLARSLSYFHDIRGTNHRIYIYIYIYIYTRCTENHVASARLQILQPAFGWFCHA